MRMRPSKTTRDTLKASTTLADLVLKNDMVAARREAERVMELQRQRAEKAAEFCRRQGVRYGK